MTFLIKKNKNDNGDGDGCCCGCVFANVEKKFAPHKTFLLNV